MTFIPNGRLLRWSQIMNDCWAIVAAGARARFMVLERHTAVPRRATLRLVERARLSNPEHTGEGRRAMRKIKSGRDTRSRQDGAAWLYR
jgi:hypothetical protein